MSEDQTDVAATLQHVFDELRAIADHPTPAVRGPVRLAMGEVAQILNVLGVSYELYSQDFAR